MNICWLCVTKTLGNLFIAYLRYQSHVLTHYVYSMDMLGSKRLLTFVCCHFFKR